MRCWNYIQITINWILTGGGNFSFLWDVELSMQYHIFFSPAISLVYMFPNPKKNSLFICGKNVAPKQRCQYEGFYVTKLWCKGRIPVCEFFHDRMWALLEINVWQTFSKWPFIQSMKKWICSHWKAVSLLYKCKLNQCLIFHCFLMSNRLRQKMSKCCDTKPVWDHWYFTI